MKVSLPGSLGRGKYQELNEPYIFSWRYIPKKKDVHWVFRFAVEKRGVTIPVTVTLQWQNRTHKRADLIAYDDVNGYCLLGKAEFSPKADATEIRGACRRHAEAYVARLWDVAKGVADTVHQNNHRNYQKYKAQLKKRLGV